MINVTRREWRLTKMEISHAVQHRPVRWVRAFSRGAHPRSTERETERPSFERDGVTIAPGVA